MKKFNIGVDFLTIVLFLTLAVPVGAQTTGQATTLSAVSLQNQISNLLQQIQSLQAQLNSLQEGTELAPSEENIPSSGTLVKTISYSGPCINNLVREIRRGLGGTDVKILQTFLIQTGYLAPVSFDSGGFFGGPGFSSNVTGWFGSLTEKAVQNFQRDTGIFPNGILTFATIAKIKEISCSTNATQPQTPTQPQTQTPTPTSNTNSSPFVDIKANNSDGPVTLTSGQTLLLTWATKNTNHCDLGAPFNSGVSGFGGSAGPIGPTHPFYPKEGVTTYSIKCFNTANPSQVATDSVTVNVSLPQIPIPYDPPSIPQIPIPNIPPSIQPAPTVDLKANGSDGPISAIAGSPVTLSWTSTGATGCSGSRVGSGTWGGSLPISGSRDSGSLTSNTTILISCPNSIGQVANDKVTINVTAPTLLPPPSIPQIPIPNNPPAIGPVTAPAPTVNLTYNGSHGPITITSGSSVNFNWSATNIYSCQIFRDGVLYNNSVYNSNGINMPSYSGTFFFGNVTAPTTTYTMTCAGPGGSASSSITVNVAATPQAQAPTISFISPSSATVGTTVSVYGSNFNQFTFAFLDGVAGQSLATTYVSPTTIKFVIPSNTSIGTHNLFVNEKGSSFPTGNSVILNVVTTPQPPGGGTELEDDQSPTEILRIESAVNGLASVLQALQNILNALGQ